jgi:hypothetical protein
MTALRSLVEELRFGLILVSHLKRPEGKGHKEGAKTSLSQLRGSGAIAQLSDMVIGLKRNQQNQKDANLTTVRVLKKRFSGETSIARTDVYTRVTETIVAQLEQGVRPWMKPWQAGHSAGHVSKPLRANGQKHNGINILMLWAQSMISGFEAPIWMTYKQAQELAGQVKKGETSERDIPFMKGYTVYKKCLCFGLI